MTEPAPTSHSVPIGYLFWIFGFTGSHRFYYGRPVSGTIYFLTPGLFGVFGVLYDFWKLNEQLSELSSRPRGR